MGGSYPNPHLKTLLLLAGVILVDRDVTTVSTVLTATHNTALSPASRAPERGRSVRGYPTHVPDPLSRRGHAIWRFLPRRAAGRYAAYDLSDGIGAGSRLSAFHWHRYLLGQSRLRNYFSRGALPGPLRAFRRAELQDS